MSTQSHRELLKQKALLSLKLRMGKLAKPSELVSVKRQLAQAKTPSMTVQQSQEAHKGTKKTKTNK